MTYWIVDIRACPLLGEQSKVGTFLAETQTDETPPEDALYRAALSYGLPTVPTLVFDSHRVRIKGEVPVDVCFTDGGQLKLWLTERFDRLNNNRPASDTKDEVA